MKKFQWTPYSVTCSYMRSLRVTGTYVGDVLTGYSVPLTEIVLKSPRRRTGEHLRKTVDSLGRSGAVRCAGFLTRGIAETIP